MPRKKILFIGLLWLIPLAARADSGALEALESLNFKAQYQFSFGGIAFGKAGVDVAQTPGSYAMTADIVSTGLVNAFIKHSSHSTATATGAHYDYHTVNYETHYQTRGKRKYAHLVYKDGVVVEEQVLPPDDRAKRPAVMKASKDQSVDPVSLVIRMRQGLFDALKKNEHAYSMYLYDGRRFSQINFTIVGIKKVAVEGTDTEVVQVDVARRMLEGLSASELEDSTKKEPPLHVYFSHDERLVPLLFEVPMWMGSLSASLKKECDEGVSCLLGIKE